jgi:wobble nucleotide-excising tRNase
LICSGRKKEQLERQVAENTREMEKYMQELEEIEQEMNEARELVEKHSASIKRINPYAMNYIRLSLITKYLSTLLRRAWKA